MKPCRKRPTLKPGAIPSHKKRLEKALLSSKLKNGASSDRKSDSLTPLTRSSGGPLLDNGGNRGPMKLQCLECRAEFDLEYDASKQLYKLKPDSVLCSHVKQGGKTAAVPTSNSEPLAGKLTTEVPKPLKSDDEPAKQCPQCPYSFGLENDLKQHQINAHGENTRTSVKSLVEEITEQNVETKPLLERVIDMNSLPRFCSLESPETNGDHKQQVHSKVLKIRM